jgi:hypothetical protein
VQKLFPIRRLLLVLVLVLVLGAPLLKMIRSTSAKSEAFA